MLDIDPLGYELIKPCQFGALVPRARIKSQQKTPLHVETQEPNSAPQSCVTNIARSRLKRIGPREDEHHGDTE